MSRPTLATSERTPSVVERRTPALGTALATKRCVALSIQLRERKGWILNTGHIAQAWTLRLGSGRYLIESFNTAFLYDGPRSPGFVFSVSIRAPRSTRPLERLRSTPWFQSLQRRLGASYSTDDVERGGRINFVRVLRRTSEPLVILRELRHIAAAVEGKAAPRGRAPSRPKTQKRVREPHEDMWTILEALEGTGWCSRSVTYQQRRNVQHNGFRWHVSAGFVAMVDSAEGPPGFAGSIDSWSRGGKRSNPIAKAAALLADTGHRRVADTHYQRWHRGLGQRHADREIAILEQALDLMTRG